MRHTKKITYKKATPTDWKYLKKRLRHFDHLETLATGWFDKTNKKFINNHREIVAAHINGKCHAVYGITIVHNLIYFSFVGSDKIFEHTTYYTKRAKEFIEAKSKEYYYCTPTVIVHPDNKASKIWLERFLGFKYTGWNHRGLQIYRREI